MELKKVESLEELLSLIKRQEVTFYISNRGAYYTLDKVTVWNTTLIDLKKGIVNEELYYKAPKEEDVEEGSPGSFTYFSMRD